MPRKGNKNNRLEIKLRARSLPRGVSPAKYYARLMEHMRFGVPLPETWEVEVGWRNPDTIRGATKRLRWDDFESAVSDSREGFNALLYDALERQLRRVRR